MQTIEELEQLVLSVTSRLDAVDKVLKARGLGVDMVMAFRCGASGLFYPADYVKEWGRSYGVGLGPDVCSESLQTDYETAPPDITNKIRSIEQIMHPVYNCKAQMDWDLVERKEYEANLAIMANDDDDMYERGPILRDKQLKNKRGQLAVMQMAWDKQKGLFHATANH